MVSNRPFLVKFPPPLATASARALLRYLGGVQEVGEQVHYAVSDAHGAWVAVLSFAAAVLPLEMRDPRATTTAVACVAAQPSGFTSGSIACSTAGPIALFIRWSTRQPNARHLTTTDFISHISANHDRTALRALP